MKSSKLSPVLHQTLIMTSWRLRPEAAAVDQSGDHVVADGFGRRHRGCDQSHHQRTQRHDPDTTAIALQVSWQRGGTLLPLLREAEVRALCTALQLFV
mgnify:CR=1 FL=1